MTTGQLFDEVAADWFKSGEELGNHQGSEEYEPERKLSLHEGLLYGLVTAAALVVALWLLP